VNRINYNKNWNNKLDCEYYTTIRKYTDEKYQYYQENLDREFEVFIDGKPYTKSKLFDLHTEKLEDIDSLTVMMDTGVPEVPLDAQRNLFKGFNMDLEDRVILLVFKNER
jgi:hypothetical protein